MRRRIGRPRTRQTGKTYRRNNYSLSRQHSAESTVRQGVETAKSIDATGKLG